MQRDHRAIVDFGHTAAEGRQAKGIVTPLMNRIGGISERSESGLGRTMEPHLIQIAIGHQDSIIDRPDERVCTAAFGLGPSMPSCHVIVRNEEAKREFITDESLRAIGPSMFLEELVLEDGQISTRDRFEIVMAASERMKEVHLDWDCHDWVPAVDRYLDASYDAGRHAALREERRLLEAVRMARRGP